MKRLVYIAMVIVLFLAGCVSATEQPETANTITDTVIPPPTSTSTPLPTATKRPSATPAIPTVTITPMSVVPTSVSPLALNEFNAATEMKRLNVIGTGTAQDIKFSPDGNLLAIATGRGVYFYDGKTFEQNNFIDVNASVSAIAFSPDGNTLAMAVDGKASLWNILSGQKMISFDGGMVGISKLAYGMSGYIAATGRDCSGCGSQQLAMILWDVKTGRQIFSEHEIGYSTDALAFTSDGKQLIFGGQGGVEVVETESGKQTATYQTGDSFVSAAIDAPYDFIFNHDGTQLFVTSFEESNEVFDITTQTRSPFMLCDTYLTSNNLNGACSKDQKIVIFDLMSVKELQSIDIDVNASDLGDMFVLSPNSKFLVYYGKTGVNIIDVKTGTKITAIQMTDFGVAQAGIIEVDGVEKYALATLAYSGQVDIFDIQTGKLIRTLKLECCEIKGFNFAPDHKTFATVDTSNLRLWDLQKGEVIFEVNLKENFSGPIAFSPNGLSVFLTHIAEDNILELDLQTRKTINHGDNSYAYDFADPFAVENYHFNDSGNLIIFGYEKNNERNQPAFQDVKTKDKIILPVDLKIDPDFIEAYSLSPDGQYLAYGTPTDIFVWNTKTLKLQSKLTGHTVQGADGWYGKIQALTFNPQSNLLVSIGWDGTIRLWNARFGTELRRLSVCCSADFTPDGRYLITYGNGVALVWGIP